MIVKKLNTKERLAMFRNFCYSAMGIKPDQPLPTDEQCIKFLASLKARAESVLDLPAGVGG